MGNLSWNYKHLWLNFPLVNHFPEFNFTTLGTKKKKTVEKKNAALLEIQEQKFKYSSGWSLYFKDLDLGDLFVLENKQLFIDAVFELKACTGNLILMVYNQSNVSIIPDHYYIKYGYYEQRNILNEGNISDIYFKKL